MKSAGVPSTYDEESGEGSEELSKTKSAVTGTTILTIKVNKDVLSKTYGANRSSFDMFVSDLESVILSITEIDENYLIDTSSTDKVVKGLRKKIDSDEVKARSKSFDDDYFRSLKIAA
jgi:hypothetical protein